MLFKLPDCGGCRTCEIACSFRLTGEFCYVKGGIQIIEQADGAGFDIKLFEHPDGVRMACDGCKDLEEPYCLHYCHVKDELNDIITEFMKKK